MRPEMLLLGLRILRARNNDSLGLEELKVAPEQTTRTKCTNDHMTLEGHPELHPCTLNRETSG